MKKIIVAEKVVKSFGADGQCRKVLDNVSLTVYEGQFISVMGPSGSGKSTLMFCLSGMDKIDSGRVIFDGKVLSDLKEKEFADIRRNEMGFVFQQPTLLKNLNILDNIILSSMKDLNKNKEQIIKKAQKLMKKLGISELEKRDITQASGGQLQRAGICRALMNNPKIIFADEPTGALNSKSAEEIMDIFDNINKEGTTIMLVTHDAKVAARTERILFIKDGKIVSELKLPKYEGKNMEERLEKVTDAMLELGI
ncbi:MAG TPA: ABC transporter ATP-binding protein [Defluviitaleaceae bacterium]|jgi:putative ABC transport system ATP-binding protein|nr:ABC transporter ATP-binding protein [Defluviitaleaceae bacterium]